MTSLADHISIRPAVPADRPALERLAILDSAHLPAGDMLVAEVDGELWAARSLADGRVISDPFRPAAEARALLELRASLLGEVVTRPRRGRGRLRPALGRRTS